MEIIVVFSYLKDEDMVNSKNRNTQNIHSNALHRCCGAACSHLFLAHLVDRSVSLACGSPSI